MKKLVGIDIGGSNIKVVLMGDRLKRSTVIKTPRTKSAFFKGLEKVLSDFPLADLRGIGVGVPGLVDRKTGKVLVTVNLPFLNGVDLKKCFSQFSNKLSFDNDVKCVLRAEQALGAARGKRNVVLIALGTGIGGALLIDGQVYLGAGNAGEIGHMIIDDGKTLEQLAGGKSILKRTQDEYARVGKYVGVMCANLMNLLDPEVIIIGGGMGHTQTKRYFKYIKPQIVKYALVAKTRKTKIVVGELGELAGAIGAALMIS